MSFTTLLLRRWLLYYAIFPSLVRLWMLQALCWALVSATLWSFGPNQDLPAWIVISVTTAISDIFTRWVTSNIADMPPPSSSSGPGSSDNGRVSLWDRRGRNWEEGYSLVIKLIMGDPTHAEDGWADELPPEDDLDHWTDPRTNGPASASSSSSAAAAAAAAAALRKQQARQHHLLSALTRELFQVETELHNLQHADGGDWTADPPEEQLSPRARQARAQAEAELTATIAAIQAAIRKTAAAAAPPKRSSSGAAGLSTNGLKKRTSASAAGPKRNSSPGGGAGGGGAGPRSEAESGSASSRARALLTGVSPSALRRTGRLKRHMTGRRVFHWNVALTRNGLPVACLSFVTLWILLIDGM